MQAELGLKDFDLQQVPQSLWREEMTKMKITDLELSIWVEEKSVKRLTSSVNGCVSQDEVDNPDPEYSTNAGKTFSGISV